MPPPTIEVVKEKHATPDNYSNLEQPHDIIVVEETGPTSSDNEGRTTAVFADNDHRSSSEATISVTGGVGGQENSNPASNQMGTSGGGNNYATHLQTESVLSSQAWTRSERFMSKDSVG